MNVEREEFSNDKNIPNYITAKFNCNEYFLMGNLLAYSYKFSDKDGFYYQNADTTEQNNIDELSYPEEFNKNIPNLDVVSMIHEIMHTYIPVDESIKFDNTVQEDVYKVVNHCLVELSSNGELGIKIANLGDYFKTPMHQEILRNRTTGEV